jgi:ribonuclease PH
VMTESGRYLEVQGTAEGMSFSRGELDELLGLAETGVNELFTLQKLLLAEPPPARRG